VLSHAFVGVCEVEQVIRHFADASQVSDRSRLGFKPIDNFSGSRGGVTLRRIASYSMYSPSLQYFVSLTRSSWPELANKGPRFVENM
jgi:hypothetical protein